MFQKILMSKANLKQFIQKVADSEELQRRIGDEIDSQSLIALGVEHGYGFTTQELQESAELSDEELDGVEGGAQNSYAQNSYLERRVKFPLKVADGDTRRSGAYALIVAL